MISILYVPTEAEASLVQIVAFLNKTQDHSVFTIRIISLLEKIVVASLIEGIMLVL